MHSTFCDNINVMLNSNPTATWLVILLSYSSCFKHCLFIYPTAPVIEPQANDVSVSVMKDIARGTIEVRTPSVMDDTGNIR